MMAMASAGTGRLLAAAGSGAEGTVTSPNDVKAFQRARSDRKAIAIYVGAAAYHRGDGGGSMMIEMAGRRGDVVSGRWRGAEPRGPATCTMCVAFKQH